MSLSTRMRSANLTLLSLALALTVTACAPATEPESTGNSGVAGDCAGITAVVEFGELDAPTAQTCVQATQPMTALEVMASAGVEIAPSVKYGDAIVCRVNDLPGADQQLTSPDNSSYTETCEEFGPIWATWSIWVNTGDGWALGQEAINTQAVKPGEMVALVWQQGKYTDMSEWLPPTT